MLDHAMPVFLSMLNPVKSPEGGVHVISTSDIELSVKAAAALVGGSGKSGNIKPSGRAGSIIRPTYLSVASFEYPEFSIVPVAFTLYVYSTPDDIDVSEYDVALEAVVVIVA